MSRRGGRWQTVSAVVPVALVVGAWAVALTNTGFATAADDAPGVSIRGVPTTPFEQPASVGRGIGIDVGESIEGTLSRLAAPDPTLSSRTSPEPASRAPANVAKPPPAGTAPAPSPTSRGDTPPAPVKPPPGPTAPKPGDAPGSSGTVGDVVDAVTGRGDTHDPVADTLTAVEAKAKCLADGISVLDVLALTKCITDLLA